MSKQAMDYIIEKMRGDSLTPLGTSRITEKSFLDERFLKIQDWDKPALLVKFFKGIEESDTPFLKGKWVEKLNGVNWGGVNPKPGEYYGIAVGESYFLVVWFAYYNDELLKVMFDIRIDTRSEPLFMTPLYEFRTDIKDAEDSTKKLLGVKDIEWSDGF